MRNCLTATFLAVCMMFAPLVGSGASCWVLTDAEGGSGDLNQTSRWKDGLMPNQGDDINIKASLTVTDSDIAILQRGKYIVTRSADAVLTIDIANDRTLSSELDGAGTCVKRGAGSLTLDKMIHQIAKGIVVRTGDLELADSCRVSLLSVQGGTAYVNSKDVFVETLDIRSPSIAYLPESGNLTIGGLTGDGSLLRRDSATASYQQVVFIGAADGRPFEFTGTVSSTIALTVSGKDGKKCNQRFLNPACASTQDVRFQDGVLGVASFGNGSNPGSFGKGTVYMQCNGAASAPTFLYLGTTQESTARKFAFTGNPLGEMTFDAGAFGGVSFDGSIYCDSSMANNSMMRLALTGSNTVNACQIGGDFTEPANAAVYMTKRGSGVWRFPTTSDTKAKYKGVFAVEAGTLEYESLAEAGSWCSLGFATVLHECYSGTRDDTRTVPYAYLLGNGGTAADADLATFSYAGTNADVNVTTRTVALKGAARMRNATSRSFVLSGVTSAQAGCNDLVLDGPGADNVLYNVMNGVGFIGLVKEGAGTWTLDGCIDVTGGVAVKEGVLNLVPADASRMTWFRFTLKKNYLNYAESVLCHFGLFDAQHNDVALGITFNTNANGRVLSVLRPGQAAFETADCRFGLDGAKNDMNNLFKPYVKDYTARWSRGGVAPDPTKSATWPALIIRLPANVTAPVVAYDMITGWYDGVDKPFKWTPTDWTIEGSVDGVTWAPVPLDAKTEWTTAGAGNNYWLSDATVCSGVSAGFPVTTTTGQSVKALELGALAVAPAATLAVSGGATVSEWDLSSSGAGTVKGVTFAASGTLKVAIPPTASRTCVVPCTLQGCNGLANLKHWTLMVNGESSTKWSLQSASENELVFTKAGFVLIFR